MALFHSNNSINQLVSCVEHLSKTDQVCLAWFIVFLIVLYPILFILWICSEEPNGKDFVELSKKLAEERNNRVDKN